MAQANSPDGNGAGSERQVSMLNSILAYPAADAQRDIGEITCANCHAPIVAAASSLDSPGSKESDWRTLDGNCWCPMAGFKHASMAEWSDVVERLKAEIPFDSRPPVFRFESVYHEHPYQYHEPIRRDFTQAA